MRSPIAAGVVLAAIAALAFGATAPVIAHEAAGPFTTAALLYIGAAASAAGRRRGPRLARADVPRILLIAALGAAIAPVLLAWGLPRAGATVGALLLNLEAVFTVLLAREGLGRRAAAAIALMVAGGVALGLDAFTAASWSLVGAIAIAGATFAWALDNTLSRPLAERDPLDVVAAKGALGATFTVIASMVAGESLPAATTALVLLVCGATGYGASLRLYLLAQRRIGAARTGSVFALAPFVGAALALGFGDRAAGPWTAVAAGLFAIGVYLHVTEHHHHTHVHDATEHEHTHRHDDGHHDHLHDPPVSGEHSHPHVHERVEHEHDHAPDIHHDHH